MPGAGTGRRTYVCVYVWNYVYLKISRLMYVFTAEVSLNPQNPKPHTTEAQVLLNPKP